MSVEVKQYDNGVYRVECILSKRHYFVVRDDISGCYMIDGLNYYYPDKDLAIEDATSLLEDQVPPIALVKNG